MIQNNDPYKLAKMWAKIEYHIPRIIELYIESATLSSLLSHGEKEYFTHEKLYKFVNVPGSRATLPTFSYFSF
jgi:hypothetical protein